MFTIDFSDHTNLVKEDWFTQIDKLLTFAKEQENIEEEAELSVTFVDKDEPEITGIEMPRVLGDIIICTDVAQEQADSYGHSFERELGFLALHGFLHLLGYDHMNEQDEKQMFGRQDQILNAYGLTRD